MKVGDLVKCFNGEVGIVTYMANHLGPGHAWVYVTVTWASTGPVQVKSTDVEVFSESR